MTLSASHIEQLRGSGWSDATIAASGWYTEADPIKVARILNWEYPAKDITPVLVLRYRDRDGHVNGYARVKPNKPRTKINPDTKEETILKYESPKNSGNRAHFTAAAVKAITIVAAMLAIVEGEKKAEAMGQAGIAAVSIPGIWNAFKKLTEDIYSRELIDDLAAIDWTGRTVLIVFDTDSRRNPDVNHAAAELARVLIELGAEVIRIHLPLGERDKDGIPAKVGADDYIVAHGEEAFRQLIEIQVAASRESPRTVEQIQTDIATLRLQSVNETGVVFVDRSPPGCGKSHADIAAMQLAGSSLTVLQTHANCEEKEAELLSKDMMAARYPKLDSDTCRKFDEAKKVIGCGLSVAGTLCPTCEFRDCCEYNFGMKLAETAEHRIATFKRAELCINQIAKGCRYITLHEDPTSMLAPITSLSGTLANIIAIAKRARHQCQDWNERDAPYFWHLEEAARFIERQLEEATETAELTLPTSSTPPRTADATLWKTIKATGIIPDADAMRACKALAAGDVTRLCVRVDRVLMPGKEMETKRSVLVFWRTTLPENSTVWISDATANVSELAAICNLPVVDRTPGGRVQTFHPVLQIPTVDLKKSTSRNVFLKTLRAVLALYPKAKRIGIICDRSHIPVVTGTAKDRMALTEEERKRIAKVEYFRSGEGRGSNTWMQTCDLLIVAGTPRVPPSVLKTRLLRNGNIAAANRSEEWTAWKSDYWLGRTVSGKPITVRTLAYRDHDWHDAYLLAVCAELQQCIGRGRSIRENGIPVVVISDDDLGLPIADDGLTILSEFDQNVLKAVDELSAHFSTEPDDDQSSDLSAHFPNTYIRKWAVKSSQLAKRLSVHERTIRKALLRLETAGRIRRVGQRGGWAVNDLSPDLDCVSTLATQETFT